jgi:MFS superfamily sulfate permease-like transporter
LVYRFGTAIVFFNAGYFKRRVMELVASNPGVEWLVVDGSTINILDVTSADMLEPPAGELAARGVRLGLANLHHDVRSKLESAGVLDRIGADAVFPTLNTATDAFLSSRRP